MNGSVLSHVAGTVQAKEEALQNTIPQTAAAPRFSWADPPRAKRRRRRSILLAVMIETQLRVLLGFRPKPLERIAAFGSSAVVHAPSRCRVLRLRRAPGLVPLEIGSINAHD